MQVKCMTISFTTQTIQFPFPRTYAREYEDGVGFGFGHGH